MDGRENDHGEGSGEGGLRACDGRRHGGVNQIGGGRRCGICDEVAARGILKGGDQDAGESRSTTSRKEGVCEGSPEEGGSQKVDTYKVGGWEGCQRRIGASKVGWQEGSRQEIDRQEIQRQKGSARELISSEAGQEDCFDKSGEEVCQEVSKQGWRAAMS